MSCLFDSMFALLKQHGIYFRDSHILRTKIALFMRDNPKYSLESGTIENWVEMVGGGGDVQPSLEETQLKAAFFSSSFTLLKLSIEMGSDLTHGNNHCPSVSK